MKKYFIHKNSQSHYYVFKVFVYDLTLPSGDAANNIKSVLDSMDSAKSISVFWSCWNLWTEKDCCFEQPK